MAIYSDTEYLNSVIIYLQRKENEYDKSAKNSEKLRFTACAL